MMRSQIPSTLTTGAMKHAQIRDFYQRPRWSAAGWTPACVDDPVKIDALVFFLDFEIYRQTGRSVTQAQYVAATPRPTTPLPRQLYRADVAAPFCTYCRDTFTRRELRLLHGLGHTFAGVAGVDMPDASWVIRDPWAQICLASIPAGAPVPYTLVLDDRPDSVSLAYAEECAEEAAWVAALCDHR